MSLTDDPPVGRKRSFEHVSQSPLAKQPARSQLTGEFSAFSLSDKESKRRSTLTSVNEDEDEDEPSSPQTLDFSSPIGCQKKMRVVALRSPAAIEKNKYFMTSPSKKQEASIEVDAEVEEGDNQPEHVDEVFDDTADKSLLSLNVNLRKGEGEGETEIREGGGEGDLDNSAMDVSVNSTTNSTPIRFLEKSVEQSVDTSSFAASSFVTPSAPAASLTSKARKKVITV